MNLCRLLVVVGALCLQSTSGKAAMITLGTDSPAPNVGQPVSVAVVAADLGEMEPLSIGAFDITLLFPSAVVSVVDVRFGDPLLGDQLDVLGLGAHSEFDNSTAGQLNLFALSFDSPADLDSLQAGTFTLATITFDTIAPGVAVIAPSINAVADSLGDPLAVTSTGVEVHVVPEPSTILLLGFSLTFLSAQRRRK